MSTFHGFERLWHIVKTIHIKTQNITQKQNHEEMTPPPTFALKNTEIWQGGSSQDSPQK